MRKRFPAAVLLAAVLCFALLAACGTEPTLADYHFSISISRRW